MHQVQRGLEEHSKIPQGTLLSLTMDWWSYVCLFFSLPLCSGELEVHLLMCKKWQIMQDYPLLQLGITLL